MQAGQRTRELIDIESVSRNEAEVEQYIRAALPDSYEIVYDHDSVIFAKPRHATGDLIVFAGHTDTVPLADNFPSAEDNGVIHGCGASDMKSGLAVMIELGNWLATTNATANVGLLFFGREELPSDQCPLLSALRTEAFADITLAVLMEPTANHIEAGCLGNLNLVVSYQGVASHSARPWLGKNAASLAINALQEFTRFEPRAVDILGLTYTEVANVTGIRGGSAMNVIPAQTEVDINIRYVPGDDAEETEAKWVSYFENTGATVAVIGNAPSARVVLDHPVVNKLIDAGALEARAKQAWTNAADFGSLGIPAVNFGPGDPFFAHKKDEQVEVAAIDESLAILQRLVISL